MSYIREQIIDAAKLIDTDVLELSVEDTNNIRERISFKLKLNSENYTWDGLTSKFVHNPDSWKWINEFTNNKMIILFFKDDPSMLKIDGSKIVEIINECTGFEFYITNDDTDFLIHFNQHDCLITYGKARDWLISKIY